MANFLMTGNSCGLISNKVIAKCISFQKLLNKDELKQL